MISYEQLTRKSSLLNFNLSGPEMHISAGSRIRFKPISKVLYKSISLRDNLIGFIVCPIWPLLSIISYAKKNLLSDD